MRTQAEIVTHIYDVTAAGDDVMGFQLEVLVTALTYENAGPWLKPTVTEDTWGPVVTDDAQRTLAVDYLGFAFGKARDHRGISASRSVDKLDAWLWLLNADVDRYRTAPYENYGVPKLLIAADLLDTPAPTDETIRRMGQGLTCDPAGCDQGCGRP